LFFKGIGLVASGADRYVLVPNIRAADELSEEDFAKFNERTDYILKEEFRSRRYEKVEFEH
jgi:hypothetical protein